MQKEATKNSELASLREGVIMELNREPADVIRQLLNSMQRPWADTKPLEIAAQVACARVWVCRVQDLQNAVHGHGRQQRGILGHHLAAQRPAEGVVAARRNHAVDISEMRVSSITV